MDQTETDAVRAPLFDVDAAAHKHIGARTHDEDGVLVRPDLGLFAVADGAGGENAGNVASSIALASLARHFEATRDTIQSARVFDVLGLPTAARRLSSGVQRANKEVLEIAHSSDRYRGMGSTIVAIAPSPQHALVHVAHVGDSRCYRMRQGRLELLTMDHSLANEVLELRPDLPDAQAAKLPRNVITRALGMSEALRVSIRTLDLAPLDRFVLCSDGLTDVLGDDEIADILQMTATAEDTARALLARALAAPADDNVAILVVRVDAAPGVTAIPKRHATRPPPARRESADPSQPPAPADEDAEIMLIEDDDDAPEIVIVPATAVRGEVLTALKDSVSGPRPRRVVDEGRFSEDGPTVTITGGPGDDDAE